jgi:hypothetical protein
MYFPLYFIFYLLVFQNNLSFRRILKCLCPELAFSRVCPGLAFLPYLVDFHFQFKFRLFSIFFNEISIGYTVITKITVFNEKKLFSDEDALLTSWESPSSAIVFYRIGVRAVYRLLHLRGLKILGIVKLFETITILRETKMNVISLAF